MGECVWLQGFNEKLEIIILIPIHILTLPVFIWQTKNTLGVTHFSCGWRVVGAQLSAHIL